MKSTMGSPQQKARIMVVDDHPFFREGVREYLNRQEDMQVCAEADSVSSALGCVERLAPDLVLLDLRLGADDVLELVKSLRARFPAVRILILSQHEEALYGERALRAGVHGYIMKQEATEEVVTAIRRVLKGELYVSRKMAVSMLSKLLQAPAASAPHSLDGLSDREFQVYQMLGAGLGTRQIAARLNLSVKTIETYRENIKHKFGLSNSVELVRHAIHWVENGGAGTLSLKEGQLPQIGPTEPPLPPP
jgi:DNA-binding NarL/FixJ family response regulator